MSSRLFRRLLHFARLVVEAVTGDITNLLSRVEQEVLNVIRAQIQEVVGGAWKGWGADAFVDLMESKFAPQTTQVIQSCVFVSTATRAAAERITEADTNVRSLAQQFADSVSEI